MNVLWLPSWYPNKTNLLTGDFIQRHARATALYKPVHVLYIVRDKDGKFTKNVLEENFVCGLLSEKIVYYYSRQTGFLPADKLISGIRYYILYRQYIKQHIAANGLPLCTHVHVVAKNAMIALWLKKKFKVPFVISEQWTAFLAEAQPNFLQFSPGLRILWRKAIKRADAISVVSNYLGQGLNIWQKGVSYRVIPNVVDERVFFPGPLQVDTGFHFVHVSTLGYQKNAEAILQAFAIVAGSNRAFTLSVFAPADIALRQLATRLQLEDKIIFHSEVPQPMLAKHIRSADALILYSKYETFGCVLIEANACGIPVIVSDIPVFHEIVEEGQNGWFAQANNPQALAEVIITLMASGKTGPSHQLAKNTIIKYGFSPVGKLFEDLYDSLMKG